MSPYAMEPMESHSKQVRIGHARWQKRMLTYTTYTDEDTMWRELTESGMTKQEMAEMLGVTESAVFNRLKRYFPQYLKIKTRDDSPQAKKWHNHNGRCPECGKAMNHYNKNRCELCQQKRGIVGVLGVEAADTFSFTKFRGHGGGRLWKSPVYKAWLPDNIKAVPSPRCRYIGKAGFVVEHGLVVAASGYDLRAGP